MGLKDEFLIVVPDEVDVEDLGLGANFKVEVVLEPLVGTAGTKKTQWEQVLVPRVFEERGVDVAFFPYPCNQHPAPPCSPR